MPGALIVVTDELIKRIMKGEVEEEVYGDVATAIPAGGVNVVSGEIESGKVGLIVSVAVQRVANVYLFPKIADKTPTVYADGIPLVSLAENANGVDDEVPLLIPIGERQKWAINLKSTAGAPNANWRVRIRKYPLSEAE